MPPLEFPPKQGPVNQSRPSGHSANVQGNGLPQIYRQETLSCAAFANFDPPNKHRGR